MSFDESANGRTVEVKIGETIEVRLPENPTTGFRWQLTADGGPACAKIDDTFTAPSGPPGQGGTHVWKFKAVAAGEGDIELRHRRHWEAQGEPAKIFKLHVKIEDGRGDPRP